LPDISYLLVSGHAALEDNSNAGDDRARVEERSATKNARYNRKDSRMTYVQEPLCGDGDGSWFVNGAPKNEEVACQSGVCPGNAVHSGGRGGNGAAVDVAQGARMPGGAALVCGLDPGAPQPTAPGATDRRPGASTISSSSAASADEPSTPFGLGERRLGDVEPEPGSPAGRAIGAMGVRGVGRPIGPGSAIDGLRPSEPGAS